MNKTLRLFLSKFNAMTLPMLVIGVLMIVSCMIMAVSGYGLQHSFSGLSNEAFVGYYIKIFNGTEWIVVFMAMVMLAWVGGHHSEYKYVSTMRVTKEHNMMANLLLAAVSGVFLGILFLLSEFASVVMFAIQGAFFPEGMLTASGFAEMAKKFYVILVAAYCMNVFAFLLQKCFTRLPRATVILIILLVALIWLMLAMIRDSDRFITQIFAPKGATAFFVPIGVGLSAIYAAWTHYGEVAR